MAVSVAEWRAVEGTLAVGTFGLAARRPIGTSLIVGFTPSLLCESQLHRVVVVRRRLG